MNLHSFLKGYNRLEKSEDWFTSKEWLSNLDIDDILDFVSKKHSEFYHVGTFAKDFQEVKGGKCVNSDHCDLSILPTRDNLKYLSVVLNTDVSTGVGIHWYCLFVDLIRMKIYVYDPAANTQHVENRYVQRLINKIRNKYETNRSTMNVVYNLHQKQPGNSGECGLYVTYFILKMIEFSEKYPFENTCKYHANTRKLWHGNNNSWYETENVNSVYKPWLDTVSGKLHETKVNGDVIFCGEPFFIFASNTCLTDIQELNEYMATYIRTVLFCIKNKNGTCKYMKEPFDIYQTCPVVQQNTDVRKLFNTKTTPIFYNE